MMGVVYEAEDTLLRRTVAVKTIELAFEVGEETYQHFEERFFTEARVAARLSHPGIVVCHDVGKDPASGKLFIVFEYLKGLTLADRIVADTIAWEDALAIAVKVARAIHHAHEHGVIHRDLKPSNIMLLDSGHAGLEGGDAAIKIMDFGVARLESLSVRLTQTGQSFGSPLYMSPEQALGRAADARSDIFSLGSVLCTLLLGRGWFEAPNLPAVLSRVINDDAPAVSKLRPHLPGTLDDVVARALAKRAEDRYASAAAMADDLEDVLAGRGPRHAADFRAPKAKALQAADQDALLAELAKDVGARGVRVDPADALASLVDEAPLQAATGARSAIADETLAVGAMAHESPLRKGDRRMAAEGIPPQAAADLTLPSWAMTEKAVPAQAGADPAAPLQALAGQSQEPPAGATALPQATTSARWRFLPKVGAAAVGALLIAGAFLLWGRRAPSESPAPSERPAEARAQGPAESPTDRLRPADSPTTAPVVSGTPAAVRTPVSPPAATVRPRGAPAAAPTIAPEPAAASPAGSPSRARMRLAVDHPLESGRLIVWIDGVLVYETKLQAAVSKTIVAIKVYEGHLEKLLDVEPGRHEVRVEVSWEDQHRVGTQLVDAAAGSTGLLEVRVARLTKELTLEWSRLAD
jgi:hypothetical protein